MTATDHTDTRDLEWIVRQLQDLADKQALRDLVARYARSVDRHDWKSMRACFTSDGTDDHGMIKGSADDLVKGVEEALAPLRGSMHNIFHQSIELHGDRALGETYALSHHRRDAVDGDGEEDCVSGLRYVDEFERVDGEWKIARRVTVYEWSCRVPARDWLPVEMFVKGRPDKTDVSYEYGLS